MTGPNGRRWHHLYPPRPRPYLCLDCDAVLTHAQQKRCPLHALARQRELTRRWKAQLAVREALFEARMREPRPLRVARTAGGRA